MNKYWHSLQFRYTFSVVILIVLIFSGTYLAYTTISQAHTATSTHLKNNQKLSDDARQIRTRVLDSYTYIDAYLLEPAHKEYKQHAIGSIKTAIDLSQNMKSSARSMVRIDADEIEKLNLLLGELKTQTEKLFLSRENVYRQYPSMGIGNDVMQPNRNAFNNAMGEKIRAGLVFTQSLFMPVIYGPRCYLIFVCTWLIVWVLLMKRHYPFRKKQLKPCTRCWPLNCRAC